jgi:hypothetical protein
MSGVLGNWTTTKPEGQPRRVRRLTAGRARQVGVIRDREVHVRPTCGPLTDVAGQISLE